MFHTFEFVFAVLGVMVIFALGMLADAALNDSDNRRRDRAEEAPLMEVVDVCPCRTNFVAYNETLP